MLGAVGAEVLAGKVWPFFSAGFLSDAIPPFQQFVSFNAAVPPGFTTFSGPMDWYYRYISDTGPDAVTTTLTLQVLNPNTGVVAASVGVVLPDGGPFDATYQTLSIPAATLNAIGFVAGDPFIFRSTLVLTAAGAGEVQTVRFSKISIPWA